MSYLFLLAAVSCILSIFTCYWAVDCSTTTRQSEVNSDGLRYARDQLTAASWVLICICVASLTVMGIHEIAGSWSECVADEAIAEKEELLP